MRALFVLGLVAGCGRCVDGASLADLPSGEWRGFDVEALPGWEGPPVYGSPARSTIADINGPGVALFDADLDGNLDLYVGQGGTVARAAAGKGAAPDRFFLGDGGGGFVEATASWGMDQRCWSQGVAVGDVDADGDPDLFVACLGRDALLRNDRGAWTDVSESAGLAGPEGWSASAAFGDADGDGDPDLYVARYVRFDPRSPPQPGPRMPCLWKGRRVSCGPEGLTPERDSLYLNRGDGTFEDASERVRVPKPAYGLGVLWLGPDIVVANDSTPNFHFRPSGRSGFVEEALLSGLSRSGDGQEQAGMGIARWGDDIVMTHFADDHHTYYERVPGSEGLYRDRTFAKGLGAGTLPALGWGVGAYDFDLDGDEDLLAVHGHVYPQAADADPESGYAQRDHLWRYDLPEGRFREAGEALGLAHRHVGRAAAFGDVDGDGDVDAVVLRLDAPPALYRNLARAPGGGGVDGRWIRFRLIPASPGATVELSTGQRRTLSGGGSFQAVSDPRAHFGLGPGDGEVRWKVTWPDGRKADGRSPVDSDVLVSAPGPS